MLGVSHNTVRKVIKGMFPEKIKNGVTTVLSDEELVKVISEVKHRGIINLNSHLTKTGKVDKANLTKIGKVDEQLAKLERMTENMVVLARELSYMLNKAFSYSERLLLKDNKQLPNPRKEIWEVVNDFKHVNGLDSASRDVLLDLAEKYQKETGNVIKTNNDYEAVIRNLILKNKVSDFVRWIRNRL
jgi:hypothetical protein